MHNFTANFVKVIDIYKEFAGNRVNELGNIPREVSSLTSPTWKSSLYRPQPRLAASTARTCCSRDSKRRKATSPNLISRCQYNQRRKLTSKLGENIRKDIAAAMDGSEDVLSIGSKPVKVYQNACAKRCVIGRDDFERAPAWGYFASQGVHYYGYKLHTICGISGVILSFDMTVANVHDLHYLKDVKWEISCQ